MNTGMDRIMQGAQICLLLIGAVCAYQIYEFLPYSPPISAAIGIVIMYAISTGDGLIVGTAIKAKEAGFKNHWITAALITMVLFNSFGHYFSVYTSQRSFAKGQLESVAEEKRVSMQTGIAGTHMRQAIRQDNLMGELIKQGRQLSPEYEEAMGRHSAAMVAYKSAGGTDGVSVTEVSTGGSGTDVWSLLAALLLEALYLTLNIGLALAKYVTGERAGKQFTKEATVPGKPQRVTG